MLTDFLPYIVLFVLLIVIAFALRRLSEEKKKVSDAQLLVQNESEGKKRAQKALRNLMLHQERIREDERTKIAREIHDDLGQHLLALRIEVSMLNKGENKEQVNKVLGHIDETMKSVRAIINNLRPTVLDLGLFAALEWQVQEFKRYSGLSCTLTANESELNLSSEMSTLLFRIVQEALTNVMRHAQAAQVFIVLRRSRNNIHLSITDDGIGIKSSSAKKEKKGSYGLLGMRERLRQFGGNLKIEDAEPGTRLLVTLPLPEGETQIKSSF